jgi:hypothetical protein
MVKKIKVVEIENVEMPETVETSSSKMKLLSPTDETLEQPPTPEPITDEPQIQEETSSDEPKTQEVEPPKEVKPKKQDEKITCSICSKTMLMKTYKYTHQKLCKPVEPETRRVIEAKPKAKKQAKPKEMTPQQSNLGQVSFTEFQEMQKVMPAPPDPLEIYRAAKEQRQQFRVQKVKSLISQAI